MPRLTLSIPIAWIILAALICSVEGVRKDSVCWKLARRHGESCQFLQFYIHDLLKPESYSNATAMNVAGPYSTNGTGSFFGGIAVFDDKITQTPDFFSKELGRARGLYVDDALDTKPLQLSLLFPFTATLTEGDQKGTISFFGQDKIEEAIREVSVIGGTGDFHMARGSALIRTFSMSAGGYNVILQVNVSMLVY